jgi:glycine/sarcosine N-methyltransferase
MYDSFSLDYDRFVNWTNRLAFEIPFVEKQISNPGEEPRSIRILDAACGTGMHAIELARRGYPVAGADSSAGMIERAVFNAAAAGVNVQFRQADFGNLAGYYSNYDALLCLGNSLPHVTNFENLVVTLSDFAACLRPNGALLIQNRNFDAILDKHERWMEPQSYREGDREWIFLRFYDFEPGGLITFNVITLYRSGQSEWTQKRISSPLYPLNRDELADALKEAGFNPAIFYGGMDGKPFDRESSSNLVVLARKRET